MDKTKFKIKTFIDASENAVKKYEKFDRQDQSVPILFLIYLNTSSDGKGCE